MAAKTFAAHECAEHVPMPENWVQVTSQEEFQDALDAGQTHIELTRAVTVEIRVPDRVVAVIRSFADAWVRLLGGKVEAWENSHVEARGNSHVVAWGNSHVEAWENSHVEAWGNSHVEARGNSHVVARGNSHVVAWENSHVEARENSHVEAWGNSHVEARAAASLSLFGGYLRASATAQVAVQLHSGAKCDGGVQVEITQPQTPQEWCDYYGVKLEDGYALLFKGVNDDFESPHNARYAPGTETLAGDWDGGQRECGGGLHFSPHPAMTKEFHASATKFVACLVPLGEIAVHPKGEMPQKVKAMRCWNHYECDVFGNVIGEKHEKPVET